MRQLYTGGGLILLAVAATIIIHSSTADIASDRAALVSLRAAVGGRVLLWNLSNPTPCSWSGVICSPDDSSVTELHLPGMGLSGQLPTNLLSNMTNLQTLSLRYNALTGPLPPDMFTSLISLRNLYLQHNFFNGTIPESLFSLTSLVRMNLADNNFSGPISSSFNNLTRLGTLYLQNNHLSGPVPDLNLPNLVQFDVSNNLLTGQIPKGLSGKPMRDFLGNSLCGDPLNSCGYLKPKKKLSGGAIAGIIIGSVLGFLLILLLLFCLCRSVARKGVRSHNEKDLEIPNPIPPNNGTAAAVATSFATAVGAKEKEKGDGSLTNALTKGLVFFGKTGLKFDLDDLLKASAEVLGKGALGPTYKAVLESGVVVAVKRLRDVKMVEKEFREKMEEIGKMDQENLVPLRAHYCNGDEKLLVYDYFPMGSLSALLHGAKGTGRTPLNWESRAIIALGAARGISYLHSQGTTVSHGSIKSSNILLTETYESRVSDHGLAQLAAPAATATRVAGYRAPEVTDPRKISQKADVYSFGVLLLELLTGKAPTHSLMNEEGVDLPRWVQSVVHEEWTAEVFDIELLRYQSAEDDMVQLLQLAVDCTGQYPDTRPTMAEVVRKIEEIIDANADGMNAQEEPDSGSHPLN